MRKLSELKRSMDEAIASASDLVVLITTDPAWDWANNTKLLDPLRAARKMVEEGKAKNGFWKAWTHEVNFANAVKKQYSIHVLRAEMAGSYDKMNDSIDQLKARVRNIKEAHDKLRQDE